ncbi:MAG: xanthine dehydrogenase family protein subunit M [Candidatus Bathyarchaeia archaeon]|jgi:CO/xanthine dehydrogenase FAD-binding subunit
MMLSEIEVVSAKNLQDALRVLHDRSGSIKPIAGGTDAIIQAKEASLRTRQLLDISSLPELRYIRREGSVIRIGALTTYSDVTESPMLSSSCRMLVEASRTIGSLQIQNRATIGGNLGNASPAGDTIPPLYALDANVKVQSHENARLVPIEKFFLGYRKIDLKPDEIITEISFEAVEKPYDGTFLKLGLREGHFISLVSLAIRAKWAPEGDRFSDVSVALGAVAPVVLRARRCEEYLKNRILADDTIWSAGKIASDESSPISDLRASANYRRAVIPPLLYKAIDNLIDSRRRSQKP